MILISNRISKKWTAKTNMLNINFLCLTFVWKLTNVSYTFLLIKSKEFSNIKLYNFCIWEIKADNRWAWPSTKSTAIWSESLEFDTRQCRKILTTLVPCKETVKAESTDRRCCDRGPCSLVKKLSQKTAPSWPVCWGWVGFFGPSAEVFILFLCDLWIGLFLFIQGLSIIK